MEDFQFCNPTKIVFSKDVISKVGGEIKDNNIKKILLLYGQGSIKKNFVYNQILDTLNSNNIEFVEFPEIKSNPILSDIQEAIKICKKNDVEAILAVGGGSAIDSAKAIAAGIKYNGNVWDLFTGDIRIKDAIPIFTVLTISATSSEMNSYTVLTNDLTKEKFFCSSKALFPNVSFIDPEIQFSLPKPYIAYSAIDALSHILEIYFNSYHFNSNIQNNLTYCLIKSIIKNTDRVLNNPYDYEARADFIWTITLSFNGLCDVGRGAYYFPCHAMEHSLSALYNIAHGAGLAIILPAWLKWKNDRNFERIAILSHELFEFSGTNSKEIGLNGINELKKWFNKIGAPTSLNHYNIDLKKDQNLIKENMMLHIQQQNGLENELTYEVIDKILLYAK